MPFPELFRDDVFRIETAQLWLRWPRAADARALQQVAGLVTVAEQTAGWERPLAMADAEWSVLRAREGNLEGRSLVLAVTRKKASDQPIGFIGVEAMAGPAQELELWYLLDRQWQGRGIMNEAVAGLAGAVFTGSAFSLMRASCHAGDPVARRVLQAAGFDHVGASLAESPGDDGPTHLDDFALARSAWWARIAESRGAGSAPNADPARAA